MHPLASGKALLASLTDEELDRYFAETERKRFTPNTITAEKALRKEIGAARKTGFASTDEEFNLGIFSIGRVVTIDGEAAGALSVAVPKVRCDEAMRDRVKDLLERTASLLETP
jgi:IclR family acetate operon transcriptional repressor